ncbi:hypothetical protein DL762_006930 [Monosporascus cannonballus]|uniref:Major facilitator superfamily (MFS) profile domain-containing protein n=1 Tax=Monosporascus cannonballus TaxID=155416 RepID=A0ABY0H1I0_9PEZI|nr:hypothetical protein DL762_006930 [Monosporascus cannonballus]RYO92443.1 hypothetical protein DL763_004670 [Monosporascus cannonballus]
MNTHFNFRQRQDGSVTAPPPHVGGTEMNRLSNDPSHPSTVEPVQSAAPQRRGTRNDHFEVPNSIVQASDRELKDDARNFAITSLRLADDQAEKFVRAALVAKDSRVYDLVARGEPGYENRNLPVTLQPDEMTALRDEKDRLFSERGILMVNVCVAIAAFLQGHVQSSINGASPFEYDLGFHNDQSCSDTTSRSYWALGATNAMPFLTTALLGCWVSMPVNDRLGRRGAMIVSSVLVLVSSLVSGFCLLAERRHRWKILIAIRMVNGLAMKDMYILHKTIEEEYSMLGWDHEREQETQQKHNMESLGFGRKFFALFTNRRLRNALISSSTVGLAQQLCGSAVNFLFGLPAIKTIDTLGRRKWLITTLPLMCIFMLMAALSLPLPHEAGGNTRVTIRLATIFLYCEPISELDTGISDKAAQCMQLHTLLDLVSFCACAAKLLVLIWYLGPIPFTLASESILDELTPPGTLGLFSGLTAIALVLVIIFVEETKELSLESLDIIFSFPKTQFMRYQVKDYLPWFFKRYILRQRPEPERPALNVLGTSYPPDEESAEERASDAEPEPSISAIYLLAPVALGAQLRQVPNYGGSARSQAQMWVYVPDNVVANPPLVVVLHSCQSSAQAYFQNSVIPWRRGSDGKGYVTVWPSSPNPGTCWDVSSAQSLTRDGGGDSTAIAAMVQFALKEYRADPSRVYVTGGSSGAMMANVLAATYPDQIAAVSAYSGVAAGCFRGAGVAQWNNTCSGGRSVTTPQAWGDVARAMYPGYDGARPKIQVWHGGVDTTIAPQNYQEEIKQWTNVFGVSQEPTAERQNFPQPGYVTSDFGDNVQGIFARSVGHSVPANLTASELWFGL